MNRFYVNEAVSGGSIVISDPEQLHHLRDVLRLKPGDEVAVFDPAGEEFLAEVSGLERKKAVLAVKSRRPAPPERLKITIACAVPKKSRMDDIVDKLTQLGVDAIIPLETERTIVKLEERQSDRLERWQKIARNAAEQSRRNRLPRIYPVMGLEDVLGTAPEFDLKLIPTLAGDSRPLREALTGIRPASVLVLIGPEGDFTPGEVRRAFEAGFLPVSLGRTVLRVETAAIAAAAFLRLYLE